MWLILAFMSAALLGCYDSLKKQALKGNAVIPVLFLNTLFSSLIFLPFIVLSGATTMLDGTIFHTASGGWEMHKYIVLKALIVLTMATRPMVGASKGRVMLKNRSSVLAPSTLAAV